MQYKGLYFLPTDVPEVFRVSTAAHLMQSDCLRTSLKISPLSCAAMLRKNEGKFGAIPVISENGQLRGIVACDLLKRALVYNPNRSKNDKSRVNESMTLADVVLMVVKQQQKLRKAQIQQRYSPKQRYGLDSPARNMNEEQYFQPQKVGNRPRDKTGATANMISMEFCVTKR